MTGLDKITDRILADARLEADRIMSDAEAESTRIRADYARRADQIRETLSGEAERDAMMQDMNRSCFISKHFNGGVECLNTVCAKRVRWCNWEWRGVQKEE
jgi:hypothetical protein